MKIELNIDKVKQMLKNLMVIFCFLNLGINPLEEDKIICATLLKYSLFMDLVNNMNIIWMFLFFEPPSSATLLFT